MPGQKPVFATSLQSRGQSRWWLGEQGGHLFRFAKGGPAGQAARHPPGAFLVERCGAACDCPDRHSRNRPFHRARVDEPNHLLDEADGADVPVPDPAGVQQHVEMVRAAIRADDRPERLRLGAGRPEVVPEEEEEHTFGLEAPADLQVPIPLEQRRPASHAVAHDVRAGGTGPQRRLEAAAPGCPPTGAGAPR